jgi:enediyne biosynthesis protein E4
LNTDGIGAKLFLYSNGNLQMQECMPTRGFQSSMDTRLTFGTGKISVLDSVLVVWNVGTYQKLIGVKTNQKLVLKQIDASGKFDYNIFSLSKKKLFQKTYVSGLDYKHTENDFVEFNREGLLPFMLSAEGPAASIGDVNGDGMDDIYLGGSKWQCGLVFLQTKSGEFVELPQPLLKADSTYEDVNSVLFDADKDGDLDLFVVSGGNEFYGKSKFMKSRLYLNNGNGKFDHFGNLPELFLTGSCVRISDFDNDGDLDLFLGARSIPWKYGIPADSYLLLNDGKGNFVDGTIQIAPDLNKFGFVKDAVWADIDNDGDDDLIIAAEWRPITIFYNDKGKLNQQESTQFNSNSGWWNTIVTGDFDEDGDLDIVAGNLGLNSKLAASSKNPVRLYVNDFDKSDSTKQILTHVINDIEYPFNNRDEITKQIPSLKKKYLSYQMFSKSKFEDFFSKSIIDHSIIHTATNFESIYIENKGNGIFDSRPLPASVQFSSINAFTVIDFNHDGHLDLLVGGNFFRSNIQMGRYDANFGAILIGDGKGNFKSISAGESGLSVNGETRRILPLNFENRMLYMFVRNNDSVVFYTANK